jgi:beta-lactamase regulating signal transducer with metallopeptidase domain
VTFDLRLAVIALGTFGLAGTAGAAGAVQLARHRRSATPALDARRLFQIRMLPVAMGAAATLQGIASFMLFEPRSEQEAIGIVLSALAAAVFALGVLAIARFVRVTMATRRALAQWMRTASPIALPGVSIPSYAIDAEFPVVAVVGYRKPLMVVARQVLASCSPEELDAIIAHERRHLRHGDNIRRVLMACLPDPLSVTRAGARLAADWDEATEQAADDAASEIGPAGRSDLAAALLRVARLVPMSQATLHLPASALYRGENLERRVRRLIGSPAPPPVASLSRRRRLMIGVLLLTIGALALHGMHEVVEAAVTYLP